MAVTGLVREYGLWNKLKAYPALDPRTDKHKGYDAQVYVAAFLFGFTSGAKSLADIERMDDDQALKDLLGIKKFPDQSALGEWLRNIGAEGVKDMRLLVRDFTAWALKRANPANVRHGGTLEAFFDDTQIEVEGKCFEGAKINYDGNLSLSLSLIHI